MDPYNKSNVTIKVIIDVYGREFAEVERRELVYVDNRSNNKGNLPARLKLRTYLEAHVTCVSVCASSNARMNIITHASKHKQTHTRALAILVIQQGVRNRALLWLFLVEHFHRLLLFSVTCDLHRQCIGV